VALRGDQHRLGADDGPSASTSDADAGDGFNFQDLLNGGGRGVHGPGGGGASPVGGRSKRRQTQRAQMLERLLTQQHALEPGLEQFIEGLLSRAMSRDFGGRGVQAAAASALPAVVLDDLPKMTGASAAKLFADLARSGSFVAALQLLESAANGGRSDIMSRISHRCGRAAPAAG